MKMVFTQWFCIYLLHLSDGVVQIKLVTRLAFPPRIVIFLNVTIKKHTSDLTDLYTVRVE